LCVFADAIPVSSQVLSTLGTKGHSLSKAITFLGILATAYLFVSFRISLINRFAILKPPTSAVKVESLPIQDEPEEGIDF